MTSPGKVYLVGAGPGSPDLITVRGLRALREASWIIADSLLPDGYLADVGIAPTAKVTLLEHGDTRDRYDAIMEEMARAVGVGQVVARLKNGDPFVFGRGCEEIAFLAARSIAWEVVPGISVSTAGPTLAALPLTSRSHGRSFAVVTARCSGGKLNRQYPLADTLIIFMGAGVLDEISSGLLRDGWSPETPTAILSRVSLAWERRCGGRLDSIASVAVAGHITSPAILVVGEAAAREDCLPRRPRILYAGDDPAEHAHLGEVIHWPALVAEPVPAARSGFERRVEELAAGRFDWIVFSDSASVRFFFREVDRRGLDSRLFGAVRIASAGRLGRHLLRERGLRADFSLDDGLESLPVWAGSLGSGLRVLISHTGGDLHDMSAAVCALGGEAVTMLVAEQKPHPDLGLPLPPHDAIFFTAAGQATAYVQAYGPSVVQGDIWSLGGEVRREVATFRSPAVCPLVMAAETP